MTPEHVPISAALPAVYRESAPSFAQIDSYLGLVDDLHRAYVARLDELTAWLSPAASEWPPGLRLDSGGDEVLRRIAALYDELAGWVGFAFPGSWPDGAEGLERRRAFLLSAARLWRRRGTPRGFLDWFCLYFGVSDPDERPFLLEHFKFGEPAAPTSVPPWLRATLLVPSGAAFGDFARRREAQHFVERYAPSHVFMRLCWVAPGFSLDPPAPYDDPAAWAPFRADVRDLLCSLVSFTDHSSAVHIRECIDEGRLEDRLDTGRLPGGG